MSKSSPSPKEAPLVKRESRGFVASITPISRVASNNFDFLSVSKRLRDLELDITELREANIRLRASVYRSAFRVIY